MKTKSKLFLILFVIVTLLSTSVFATEATTEGEAVVTSEVTDETTAAEGETVEGETTEEQEVEAMDRFFAGDEITIDTLIDGNVFAIGKNVKVTGQIGGDLFVIAENLTLDGGSVYGSIFATVAEVTINGQLYDLYVASDKLTIEYDGYIYRDLKAMSTEISINGIIGRNAYIEADNLTLEKDCIMQGNLNYTAQAEATYPEEGVKGEKNFTKSDKKLFDEEIRKSVQEILSVNNITNETTEEDIKAFIISYVFDAFSIDSDSKILKRPGTVPALYFYIAIGVIVVLVILLVLPIVAKNNRKKASKKHNANNVNTQQ